MKLTREEFAAIRERRSQDDLNTLIAFVEYALAQDDAAPKSDTKKTATKKK